ncbi:unnamed protein product [Paramecium pentaurelia]|uniref:Uncharacterized protein n=1 Tax=Paramecium pentaurelia TaxID=43138 RepID=A0A8S1X988_9CILI|nr:unnamed protein product [Paramecium pentaurelia]
MNQSETCYDSDLFVNEQLTGLTCPIGLGVLRNPVFDQCGHVFCHGCISDWLKKQKLCPINKQPLNENQLIKAIPIKNMIDELELKQCLLKCNWKGSLDKYYTHDEKECPEKQLHCVNKDCNMLIKRASLKQHLENECLYQQIVCEKCQQNFIKSNQNQHEQICEGRLIQCEDCQQDIKFIDYNQHQIICPQRKIQCPIEGCNEKIKEINLEEHVSNFKHILILQQQIKQLKEELILSNQKQDKHKIPYLDGWRTSFSKKTDSREWLSINSMQKIQGPFCLRFEAQNVNKRPNQWRAVIGVSKDKLQNNHLWYRQKNSFVWIFGGFKCSNQAEIYGSEVQHESFQGKMTFNQQGELSYEYSGIELGVAFVLPKEAYVDGIYLILSFVNQGKIRLLSLESLT